MQMRLLKLSYLPIILVFGCGKESPRAPALSDLQERLVIESLIPVADSLVVMKDSSLLYLLDFRGDPPDDSRFLFHALVERDTFLNLDFDKDAFRVKSISIPGWPEFRTWAIPLPEPGQDRYRIGEYTRRQNQEIIKYWQNNLNLEAGTGAGLQKCWDQPGPGHLNTTKLALDFQLGQGKFFELPHGYYLLLYKKQCWVFKPKEADTSSRVLIHFVHEDGSFDNYSFAKSPASYIKCIPSLENYDLTRIIMAEPTEAYDKLRFGEYTSAGNLWVQSYRIRNVQRNELLVYDNEFSITPQP